MRRGPVLGVAIAWAIACGLGPDEHGDHGDHGDHGHDAAEDPRPGRSVTVYEDGLELFMEYPAFVVGQESPLVAHFTDARDPEGFTWVTSGRVMATLAYAAGGEDVFIADELLRNGIFKPIVKPSKPGEATLTLALVGDVGGTVHVGTVVVHDSIDAAVRAGEDPEPDEPTVGYLKEAQWKTVYATAPAEKRSLRASVRATGEIRAPVGASAEIDAPFAGRIEVQSPRLLGQRVREGEVLGLLVPIAGERGALEADRARAEVDLALAEKAAARAESLYPDVISRREVDIAKADVEIARAQLSAASRGVGAWRGSGGAGFELRAPIDGVIAFTGVEPGHTVAAGARLLSIVDGSRLWLVAHVFESDAARVAGTPGAMFTVSGRDEPVLVDASTGGETVAVGAAIVADTRTLPVIYAFPNPGDLVPGMFAKVRVFSAETTDGVAIPAKAVVDDGGFPTVFVMDGGESFFKRRVTLGVRDGDHVQVLAGVAAGERVVSRGAWEVKLSTTAGGIPEHGHQH